jgi:NitT/TauT family transport system permease protein
VDSHHEVSVEPVSFKKVWGDAFALFYRKRENSWIDLLLVVGLGGILFTIISLAQNARATTPDNVEIDLSIGALVLYTFYSLLRGLIAYVFSLAFTLVYGYWAAKDRTAEKVLVPLLDILQSIPVLSFFPPVLLALIALFPSSNIGLELTCILMIFTGQAWNMTFSFYHSLRSIPDDQKEVATVYRFNWWQRFRWLELPSATIGLVWNSMMSMAGGWFFLILCEAPQIGEVKYRLPGIGSYMEKAQDEGLVGHQLLAIAAMMSMIVLLDQLLWRPVVAWSQKFRVEEGGNQEKMTSWFLDWLRRSHILSFLGHVFSRFRWHEQPRIPLAAGERFDPTKKSVGASIFSTLLFVILLGGLAYGAWQLVDLLRQVPGYQWLMLFKAAAATLGRVLAAIALATVWALPAGLAIGLSPRLSRILQPVIQVLASFPAPMLYAFIIGLFQWIGVSLNWYSIVLMLAGTQWYILFNIVAGTTAIPADLKEVATSYRIRGWQRFRVLYFPAVFPYLVTGWITAAGGAWNASIISEFVKYRGDVVQAFGLGAVIAEATSGENADFPLLAAGTVVMSTVVVVFNRTLWKRLYRLAEERYSLNK